jgi:geranylgeranyl diphosphate synthase type I
MLEEYKKIIDESYLDYLEDKKPELQYKPMEELLGRGGKRLRPILCLLSCELVGGEKQSALPTAIAIEFFHNFTLIHDDIQDGSILRRGQPTLHIGYGTPLAINVGDGLYALSYHVLRENERVLGIQRAWSIFESFNEMNVELVEGQAMDLAFKETKYMDEDTLIEHLRKKTGVLFATSAKCGAIAGGGTLDDAERLGKVWEYLGISFQIQDDILDIIGEEEKFGKNIGEDISEGKPTLLLVHCLSKCNEEEMDELKRILSSEYDQDKIDYVIELYNKYGCIDYSRKRAKIYLEDAFNMLNSFPDNDGKEKMLQMAQYFVNREE